MTTQAQVQNTKANGNNKAVIENGSKAVNESSSKKAVENSPKKAVENSPKKTVNETSSKNATQIEKTSGRNFYAVKQTANGKEIPYAFEKIAKRNEWVERNENTKPVSAFEVYQMLHKTSNDVLIANRQNRVLKVSSNDEIFPEKGQRLLIRS